MFPLLLAKSDRKLVTICRKLTNGDQSHMKHYWDDQPPIEVSDISFTMSELKEKCQNASNFLMYFQSALMVRPFSYLRRQQIINDRGLGKIIRIKKSLECRFWKFLSNFCLQKSGVSTDSLWHHLAESILRMVTMFPWWLTYRNEKSIIPGVS